jgi:hypothetical protein
MLRFPVVELALKGLPLSTRRRNTFSLLSKNIPDSSARRRGSSVSYPQSPWTECPSGYSRLRGNDENLNAQSLLLASFFAAYAGGTASNAASCVVNRAAAAPSMTRWS